MPFYCGKRSASICVVLGPKKSSTYSSEYASGFFEPVASHLPAAILPRNEGLLGQTPSARLRTILSGGVAQLVEQRTHKPRVSRSIRDTATKPRLASKSHRGQSSTCKSATGLAQLVLSAAPPCEDLPLLSGSPTALAQFNG